MRPPLGRTAALVVTVILSVVARQDAGVSHPGSRAEAILGNTKIQLFSKAKKLMCQVYIGQERRFYCGWAYSGRTVDVASCGDQLTKSLKRAQPLEWEHMVLGEAFGQSFPEWGEEHPECGDQQGNALHRRNCASKMTVVESKYSNASVYQKLRTSHHTLFRLSSAPQSPILNVPAERRVERGRAMDWKQLLAYITGSVDEELLLRNEYLVTENRILRQQIKGRVQLTGAERRSLAEIGKQLSKKALENVASLVKPDTILGWHRRLVAQKFDGSKQRKALGRPRVDNKLEDLVVRMAQENRSWGYDRIVGALANLGYTISDQTVGNILKRHGIPPAPERKTTATWKEFIPYGQKTHAACRS
jgi:hypothetical protein